ncbi:MAG TPA: biotin transporter BioY [Geminicoccus sp.]|uniref:biotin transporter BioY n=1 Tax=Geminicoccus sp. TaxID=2024832 RepID=UPI002CD62A8B|nr:biotin transporter BioY [Geminicoccus sp.]HWL69777.1 biotin transporter BioY [Geminicoccus sp.]
MHPAAETAVLPASFVPLRLTDRPLAWKLLAVLLGTLFLAASSWIEVPMLPVPMTMQTFAITLVGAAYGWRLGTLTVLAWLGQAMVGLPVLAGGAGGPQHFVGPTAGYLAAFPVAALLVGWLAERGWTGRGIAASFGTMLLGNLVILLLGAVWLSGLIGAEGALQAGVLPFLPGAFLKAALAAALLVAWRRTGRSATDQ